MGLFELLDFQRVGGVSYRDAFVGLEGEQHDGCDGRKVGGETLGDDCGHG